MNPQSINMIPVGDLVLDTQNPRIRKWLEMYEGDPSPQQIYLALGAGAADVDASSTTFNALKESIRTNGGVITPIIANKSPDGRMVVVEGNTRLAIYRSFLADGVPGQWERIPTIIHDGLPQLGIDAIRLQAHLVGPRPWDPYSKAKYLHSLRTDYQIEFSKLVDLCGGKKREVQDYIDAYNEMELHYRKVVSDDSAFDPSRFSAFVELQKPSIRQAVINAGYTIEDFSRWVHERLIDPLLSVRDLPNILSSDQAREKFLKEGTKEAVKLLYEPPPPAAGGLSIEQLCLALTERLNQVSYNEIKKMRADSTGVVATRLLELRDIINDACAEITSG